MIGKLSASSICRAGVGTSKFRALESQYLQNCFVEVEQDFLQWSSPGKASDAQCYFGGAVRIGDDSIDGSPCLVQIGWLSVEPAQTSIAARHNRSQWLIDLVGDRGCEFTQGRQARTMRQLRSCFVRCHLRRLDFQSKVGANGDGRTADHAIDKSRLPAPPLGSGRSSPMSTPCRLGTRARHRVSREN